MIVIVMMMTITVDHCYDKETIYENKTICCDLVWVGLRLYQMSWVRPCSSSQCLSAWESAILWVIVDSLPTIGDSWPSIVLIGIVTASLEADYHRDRPVSPLRSLDTHTSYWDLCMRMSFPPFKWCLCWWHSQFKCFLWSRIREHFKIRVSS